MVMLFPDPLEREYERWLSQLSVEDCPSSPKCLNSPDILRAHFTLAAFFKDDGRGMAGVGPRDVGLLQSAVSRQWVGFGNSTKWSHQSEVLATLFFGLVKDHPFHDANKRTALLCLLWHLHKVNLCPTVNQQDLEDFTVAVADNRLDQFSRFKQYKKDKPQDAEVLFIADYVRRNTRQYDRRHRVVTYHQLDTALRRHGYELHAPNNNSIDLVKVETRRAILGIAGKLQTQRKRIANIGFPGWKTQVSRKVLKDVLSAIFPDKATRPDWPQFFGETDPLEDLLASYQEPLRRLADR